jgi:hypothetical protein
VGVKRRRFWLSCVVRVKKYNEESGRQRRNAEQRVCH